MYGVLTPYMVIVSKPSVKWEIQAGKDPGLVSPALSLSEKRKELHGLHTVLFCACTTAVSG